MQLGKMKKVTARQLKVGQKVEGWSLGQRWNGVVGYVKNVTPSYVTLNRWSPDGKEERVDADSMFDVEMTDQEFFDKYRKDATDVFLALSNKLSVYEIGEHEMANGWVDIDVFNMAAESREDPTMPFRIIGVCSEIIPKTSWLSGLKLNLGLVAETDDGQRFWCHWSTENLDYILKHFELRNGLVYSKYEPVT